MTETFGKEGKEGALKAFDTVINSPYEPKPMEVAGFEIQGYRQPDGSIKLGSKGEGAHLKDFPREVRLCGMVYTLETTPLILNLFKRTRRSIKLTQI